MKNTFFSKSVKELLLVSLLFFVSVVFAQAPTISSFTPTSGAVGATVTITGTGFNTTAANNIVYFGGVKATVSSATATQIVVTVPVGGSGKVSATNISTFLTAYSGKYFSITYTNGGHDINSCAFPLNNTITTISPTVRVGTAWHDSRFNPTGTGDFNGDGKIDLVKVDGNTTVKGFGVYVNTSTGTGNFNFAVGIQVTSTRALSSLLVADFDNDGKLDVAASDGSNYEIYKNTTTSSTITFAAPVVVSAGSSLRNLMGDINGDGKMDIVYSTNYGSVIYLILNTSSGGNLTFNGAVNYIAAMGGNRGLGVGDFNNDFKTDVVTGDEWNNGVNNGGTIQLSTSSSTVTAPTKVDVTSLIGCCFEGAVEAIDLNGDGKDDLIKRGYDALKISQNNWSSGVMTSANFSPVISKSLSGYTSNHLDMNGDGKIDLIGFNILANGIYSIKNNVGTTITAADLINQTIDASVVSPWGGFIGDFDLDGRNDVISLTPGGVNSTIQIYKNSPLPLITSSGTINAFVACAGSASTPQTVSISGDYLTSAITLTAPTNFEISLASGSGYAASLTLSPSSGSVSATTIYIRTKSTATGTLSGNLTLAATCATTQSISVSGTVNAVTSISAHPSSTAVSVCQNATLSALSVTAAGTSLTYQWYSNTTNSTSGATAITGATSTSYTPINSVASALYYYCVVTGTCGTVTSNISGLITVSVTPVAGTASATFSTICSGSTTTLSLTGNTGTIQWQSSANNSTWTNISGATAASYTTPALSAITYYRAIVTSGSCTAVNSNVLTITIGTNQPFGNALALNGSGKIQFANQAQSAVGANFTVEAWVNVPSAASNIQTILSNSAGIGQAGGFRFGINTWNTSDGKIVFEGGSVFVGSSVAIAKNVWQHVAVVVNNSVVSYYINGVFVGTSTGSFPPLSSTVLTLGSFSDNQYLFNGMMDEVRLWNVSKTQQEILASMYSPLSGAESALVAYFNFNQGTPGGTNTGITDLIDNGPNALTGSLSEITRTGTAENFVANANLMAITGSLACVGSTVQLYHPQSGGTWSSATTGVASITSTGLVSCLTAGSSVISYVYTYNGCQFTNTYTMTVNATPVAPTVTTTSVSYCQNATATALVATAATSHSLRWYTVASGGTGSTTAITPVTSTAGTATYYVSQANASGCEGPRVAITVTVSPTSVAGTASVSASAICGGSTVDLSLTGNTGTVQWQSSPNNSTWTPITGATAANFTTSALNATTYFRAVVSSGGCTAVNSNVLTVTVTTVAVPTTTTINISECQGNTATQLSATALSGHTLQWYTVASGGTAATTAITPDLSTAGVTTYYVSQLNNTSNCESTRVPINVTVYALPAAPTTTTTINYCQGATATALAATSQSGFSLQWYTAATGGTASASAPTPTTTTAGTTTYYVSQKQNTGTYSLSTVHNSTIPYGTNQGQTFQVANNVVLNTITLTTMYWASASTAVMKIYNGFGGSLLATANNTFNSVALHNNNVTFSFANQNLLLNSGQTYYFEITSPQNFYVWANSSSVLATGAAYLNGAIQANSDLSFTLQSALFANPCESTRTAIVVNVNEVPTISGVQNMTLGGSNLQLTGSGTPATTNPWVSSNSSVATISASGEVTAVAGGTTTITYTNASGCAIMAIIRVIDCNQPFGNSLAFGVGSTAANADFVNVPSRIFPSQTVANFTIETWINPAAADIMSGTTGTSWRAFLGYFGTKRSPSFYITNNGVLHASWQEGSTFVGTPISASSPTSLVANKWTHVALVKDGTTMRLFVDGVQLYSMTCLATLDIPDNGYWLGKSDNQFNGVLDEVRFWSTARTPAQIQAAMNSELVGNETGLLAYFDFNQGIAGGNNTSITTVTNKANNALNGTLTNFTRSGTSSNFVGSTISSFDITGPATICANTTAQYSHIIPGGTWSVSNGANATVSATGLLTSAANENVTLSYTYTINGCSVTATRAITINTPVAPVATSTVNYCIGVTPTALSATVVSGNTLQWYTVSTGGTASTTAPTPSVSTVGTAIFYVSQKNSTNNCESSRTAITVNVNALPTISGAQSMTVGGSALQLTGSGTAATTNPWLSSATGIATISDTGEVTAIGAGSSIITYTVTNGCTATAVISVVDCSQPFGNALQFDGVNDSFSTASNLSALSITGNITIETWIKFDQVHSDYVRIIGKGDGTNRTYGLWLGTNGKLLFQIWNSASSGLNLESITALQTGVWYHISATRNGNTAKIYINGIEDATTSTTVIPNVNTLPLTVGYGNMHTWLKGALDEVRIWNVARSLSQIQQGMYNAMVGNESGLVAYYDFNQGIAGGDNTAVNSVLDRTTNVLHGTLTNFAKTGTASNFVGNTVSNFTISGVASLCSNSTAQYTHQVSGGTWSVSSGAAATVNTSGLLTTLGAENITLTYNYTINGCAKTANRVIQVQLPVISGAQTMTVGGATLSLTATSTAASTNPWLSSNTSVATVSATGVVTAVTVGATTITYTNNLGCTATATITVNDCRSPLGNTLNFDGVDDYVTVGDTVENLVNLTEEAWVFWRGSSNAYSEIYTKDLISSFAITNTNKLHANFGNGTSWSVGLNSTSSIPLNTWTHLAVTRDNGVVKMYINGVEESVTAIMNVTGQNSTHRSIGAKLVGTTLVNGSAFNGAIDEVRFWSVAKTPSEISNSRFNQLVGNETNLVAYYNFNQGIPSGNNSATTTLTAVTGGFNGTFVNMSRTTATSNFILNSITIDIVGNSTVCSGGTTLFTHPISGGTWTVSSGSSVTIDTTGSISAIAIGNSTISYSYTINGCPFSVTKQITVIALPVITTQPSTLAQNVCLNGTTSSLSVTATGPGLTYQWYKNSISSNTGGTLISGATFSVYMPSNNIAETTYYYCVVSGTCSPSVTSDVSGAITIVPVSVPGTAAGTTSICLGTSTVLTLTGNNGTIQWQQSSLLNGTYTNISGATSGSFTTPTLNDTTFYRAQVTNGVCAATNTNVVTVTVTPLPVISGPISLGTGDTITLSATTTAASSNAWVSSTPSVASVSNTGVVNGLSIGTTTITYTNSIGCTDTEIITVVGGTTQIPILTLPATNTSGATTLNFNYTLPETPLAGSVRLIITPTAGGTAIIWNMNNATSASFSYLVGSNPTAISNVVSGTSLGFTTYNITLSYQDAFGNPAASVTNTNIQTLAPPVISFANANYSGIINQPISIQTVNTGGGMVTYSIAPSLPAGLSLNAATGLISGTPTVTLAATTFTVTATNAAGTDTESFILFIDADTDGDGIGDATDPDIDGDGTLNGLDTNPTNPCLGFNANTASASWQTGDCDGDGIPNGSDADIDGNGTTDNGSDTDGDGINDANDTDIDGDGIQNGVDNCPTIVNTSIITQPSTQTVNSCLSTVPFTLTVAAAGQQLTYQWYSNTSNSNVGGTVISGATMATYVPTTSYVSRYYYVVVSGTCGTVTSNVSGAITINPTSVGGSIAGATTVCSGTNATVLTLSGNTGTIQWQSSTDNISFTNINGATASTFTATNLTATTYYRAVVTSGVCTSATTTPVTITVSPTSVSGSIAGATSVCSGTNSTALTLSGNTGTIQWQSSTDNISFTTIAGATSSTYTVSNITATTYYRAVVTSGVCSSATTASVTINVSPTSLPGSIAGATSVCSGTNSTVLTLSGNTGTIQWQWSTDNVTFFNIPSATTSTYTVTNITLTTYYRAVVTSGVCSSATTTVSTITVNPTSVAGTIAGAATVCSGTNATVLTLSGNTGTIQWQRSTDNVTFTTITGATASTFTATNLTTTTYYRALVTSGVCASATTASVTITVNPTSVSGSIAGATTVCSGTNTSVLTLSGNTGTIQWQSSTDNISFTNIAGAIASTFTATNLTATTYYRAVVTSGVCPSATTASVTITVNPTSVAGNISGAATVCSGTNATVLTLAGNTGTIQWQSSTNNVTFTSITGATASTFTATNLTATTYFRAVVTSGVCLSATTASVAITVNPTSVAGNISGATTVCSSTNSTVLTLAGNTGTIQWQSSTDNTTFTNITGATALTYTATNISTTTYYRAIVTSGLCSSATTAVATITYIPIVVPTAVSNQQFCYLNNPTVSNLVTTSGVGIRWYATATGGIPLTGTTPLTTGTTYYASQTISVCESPTRVAVTVLLTCPVDAIADNFGSINGYAGATTASVLANDTINGGPLLPSQVILTGVTVPTGMTLNANGTITIAPQTAAGTYNVTYRICELLNPTNCDTVTFSIVVGACLDFAINDCDLDGESNGTEATNGTNPSDACSYTNAPASNSVVYPTWSVLDCDGDGVINGQEIIDGTSPINPCSSNPINITVPLSTSFLNGDCDDDGLLNGEEMGSNVNYPNDSNGNGIPDYLEVNNHTISEDNLEVYSSLTPNGDGNNDVFIIRNIENYPENNVSIYNRWGIIVYDVDGYGQDNKYFKGISEGRITINSQDELPIGTYFYIIKYKNNNGEQKQRSGYLYINR